MVGWLWSGSRSSFDYVLYVLAMFAKRAGYWWWERCTSSSAPVSSSELLESSPMLTSCGSAMALPLPFPSVTVWADSLMVPPAFGSVTANDGNDKSMAEWGGVWHESAGARTGVFVDMRCDVERACGEDGKMGSGSRK